MNFYLGFTEAKTNFVLSQTQLIVILDV